MAGARGYPFLLYRTGSVPSTAHAGPRSLLAFWMGGAAAVPGTTPTPAARSVGWPAGKRRHEPKQRDPWAQTLTPKAWDELQALLTAERATAERADATTGKRAAALNRAADAARDAIEAIERAAVEADTLRITAALEAATGATRITAVLKHARAAVEYAHALRIAIEEAEEEEEAIVLLLMH